MVSTREGSVDAASGEVAPSRSEAARAGIAAALDAHARDGSGIPAEDDAASARERLMARWEIRYGCSLAVLAAALACNDLGGGKYGGDELQFANEKTSAYMWYQSKGIKESLAEGQADLLASLLAAGVVTSDARARLTEREAALRADVDRYGREKKEILLGSRAVGPSGYAQDVGGEMGKVVGAEEYAGAMATLGRAGDRFDLATLFLQLSLVLGAIGIILRGPAGKKLFFTVMLCLGAVGVGFSVAAYRVAWTVAMP